MSQKEEIFSTEVPLPAVAKKQSGKPSPKAKRHYTRRSAEVSLAKPTVSLPQADLLSEALGGAQAVAIYRRSVAIAHLLELVPEPERLQAAQLIRQIQQDE